MTFAVVPAAGLSTRMGRPKLMLPLGESTVIGRVVTSLREGGVETVVVITGPEATELTSLAEAAGAQVIPLGEPTSDMRQTVEQGLAWLEHHLHPLPGVRWLLCPADHPGFSAPTVRRLLNTDAGPAAVVIPTHQGTSGHPVLFRWRHVAAIRELSPGLGINDYVRSVDARLSHLPVDDSGILLNLNQPADYERLLERHSR